MGSSGRSSLSCRVVRPRLAYYDQPRVRCDGQLVRILYYESLPDEGYGQTFWNVTNRDYLVREQAKDGHERGSWYLGRSHFNQVGGRLYCTAIATLTLEVYYRFMSIYSEIDMETFDL